MSSAADAPTPHAPTPQKGRAADVGFWTALRDAALGWRLKRVADPGFQSWAARNPLTRGVSRRKAETLFDLTAGFVYSQVLFAVVELEVLEALADGPLTTADLARRAALPEAEADRLLNAAAGVGLLSRRGRTRGGADRWGLAELGAAALGAPGVREMVRHHRMYYADLADPVALLRGEVESPELSRFWGYVHGRKTHAMTAEEAGPYSALMAESQAMVAEETLAAVDLRARRRLLDVGGGEGAFAAAAARATPALEVAVFDLPAVVARAPARFESAGVAGRAQAHGGSFLTDSLPGGADVISLIRVCYDHDDPVVQALMAKIHAALPAGGMLLVSEPMAGGDRPTPDGDAYFGFYMLAMRSGRARSAARIAEMARAAGFVRAAARPVRRRFLTQVVVAEKA